MQPGDRVGAILSSKDGVANFLGYGVYEGDFVPDQEAGGFASLIRSMSRKNPKIRLDNGDIVWGCECWWGSEEKVKERIAGMQICEVKISEARKEAQKEDQ